MIIKVSTIKTASVLFCLALVHTLPGCSKEKEPKISQKIVFKAEASSGVAINMLVYGFDADLTTLSNVDAQTWTSPEIVIPANKSVATITANAMGTNSTATLKVKILIDGVEKKLITSTGTALSATAQYNLQ